MKKCTKCNGTGIYKWKSASMGFAVEREGVCYRCDGKGEVHESVSQPEMTPEQIEAKNKKWEQARKRSERKAQAELDKTAYVAKVDYHNRHKAKELGGKYLTEGIWIFDKHIEELDTQKAHMSDIYTYTVEQNSHITYYINGQFVKSLIRENQNVEVLSDTIDNHTIIKENDTYKIVTNFNHKKHTWNSEQTFSTETEAQTYLIKKLL